VVGDLDAPNPELRDHEFSGEGCGAELLLAWHNLLSTTEGYISVLCGYDYDFLSFCPAVLARPIYSCISRLCPSKHDRGGTASYPNFVGSRCNLPHLSDIRCRCGGAAHQRRNEGQH
jgi:hypothetical protein